MRAAHLQCAPIAPFAGFAPISKPAIDSARAQRRPRTANRPSDNIREVQIFRGGSRNRRDLLLRGMNARITQGLDALTEKEKETLRLILHGHDAKSIARSFDLSVHTINERLRDARRKLAVSSSREAARLLFDAEGTPPNPLGYTKIGDVEAPSEVEGRGRARRTARLAWIIIGGATMSLLLGLLALATFPQQEVPSTADSVAAVETKDPAIVDTARRFAELGDQGKWAETYGMTGTKFQSTNTLEVWVKAAEKVRPPLGAVQSRVLLSEQFLPAPPHGYEVVKFRTNFANKTNVVETVTLVREDGEWKVAGVTVG